MILSPDDHRSLQAIDGELATCEPHLAAMFKIFSRLNAEEAPPPSEDQIAAMPRADAPADPAPRGWRQWRQGGRARRRSRAARARLSAGAPARAQARSPRPGGRPGGAGGAPGTRRGLWRPVAAIGVPAVLLVTVLIVMFVTLTSSIKCRPAPATSGSGSAAPSAAPVIPGSASVAGCRLPMRTRG
ncbi:MAG TPA: hypothetical protein VGM79_07960 [Streptosporangiaceae bacterium]|jgi:hypothetical protein